MDREYFIIRAEFIASFGMGLACVAVTSIDVRLLLLGQVGGHTFWACAIGTVTGILGLSMIGDAWAKKRLLKQMKKLFVGQSPYGDRRTNVAPNEAVRDLGGGRLGRPDDRPRLR